MLFRLGPVALAVAALSACGGPAANGTVVGVPPSVHRTSAASNDAQMLAGVHQLLDQGLAQADATQANSDVLDLAAEANALANDPALIGAERIDALRSLGASAVASREAFVNALIGGVQGDPVLAYTYVDGRSLSSALMSLLNGVQTQLRNLDAAIASEPLADVLRTDVTSVASSTHIYGVVNPQVHVVMSAADALRALGSLAYQLRVAEGQIGYSGYDPNYGTEQQLAGACQAALSEANATALTAARQALAQSPSNGSAGAELTQLRQALSNLTVGNGALAQAGSDINQLRYLLAGRQG